MDGTSRHSPSSSTSPSVGDAAEGGCIVLRSPRDRQRAVLAGDRHGRRGCDAARASAASAHPGRTSLQDVPSAARRSGGTRRPPRPQAPPIREEPELLRRVRDVRADASRRRRGRDLDAVRRRARVDDTGGTDAADGVQQADEPLLRLREPRRDRQRRARRQARRRRSGCVLCARRRARPRAKGGRSAGDLLRATADLVPVGCGVHTGLAYVGAVGSDSTVADFTALGDPVNVTARLASLAGAGEALISDAACTAAGIDLGELEPRELELKGPRRAALGEGPSGLDGLAWAAVATRKTDLNGATAVAAVASRGRCRRRQCRLAA
jgi:class 3 adenylate cyclase